MKAIIPIAGLGTRCLPFTKVIPKAMLPVAGKPCVQWIVEELGQAGIREIIFITSQGQDMVEEYFTKKTWYDEELIRRGKTAEADKLTEIRELAHFTFVSQAEQLGDGHAILQAKHEIGDEPFLVIFGDCLFKGRSIEQVLASHRGSPGCKIGVQEIPGKQAREFGITETVEANPLGTLVRPITRLTEKPRNYSGDTALAIVGRYLLTPAIWPHLEAQHSASGEIRLIDALRALQKKEPLHAVVLEGTWLDTGTLEGLRQADVSFSSGKDDIDLV